MAITWIVDAGDFPQGAGGVANFGAEAELGDAADVCVLVHAHLTKEMMTAQSSRHTLALLSNMYMSGP